METQTFADDLRRYALLLWHWAWLILLVTIAVGVAAYLISLRATPVYRASTRLLVNLAPANKSTDYASLLTSERLARTYSELLTTNPVLEQVIKNLDLDTGLASLRAQLQVQLVRDTQLIDLHVEDTDPLRAAAIANEVAAVFSQKNESIQAERYTKSKVSLAEELGQLNRQIQETTDLLEALNGSDADQLERERLETNLTQYRQTYALLLQNFEQVRVAEASTTSNVVPVEMASAPFAPIRPRPLSNTLVAALASFISVVAVIFLIDAFDDSLTPDQISRQFGLPVLGVIAHHQANNGTPVVEEMPRAPVSEAFRSLRTNIQFASVDRALRTMLVTSPSPEDGKSTVAINLGVSIAQSGREVVVLDADLRRPQVHKKLGLANHTGVSDLFVSSGETLNGSVQRTSINKLSAITSGNLPPNPSELLGSEKMSQLITAVDRQADIVIIDSPPLVAVTDAAVLSTRVDGVLLVVKPGVTKQAAFRHSIEQLQRVGAKILGVVLNDVPVNRSRYKYAYYKGYYYSYHKYYSNDSNTIPIKP